MEDVEGYIINKEMLVEANEFDEGCQIMQFYSKLNLRCEWIISINIVLLIVLLNKYTRDIWLNIIIFKFIFGTIPNENKI